MSDQSLRFPDGSWATLLKSAYGLLDAIASDGIQVPRWSIGGGTVLMFYYAHRISKDIDIFISDPQFLGYINPRIGGCAEDLTSEYIDGADYIKLFLDEGEIDFVATVALTKNPFKEHEVLGRKIFLETPVEIVAKKLWYRGNRATPRDLLDLAVVIEHQYGQILEYRDIFAKNIQVFIQQCESRQSIMLPVFDAIEKINFKLSFDECLERAKTLQSDLLKVL